MKKILIVVPSIKIGGGAEKVAAFISNKLIDQNYDVIVLFFYKYANEHPIKAKTICLEEDFKGLKIIKLIYRSIKIAKTCKKEKIDTIISFMEPANFSAVLSKLFGYKSKVIVAVRSNPLSFNRIFRLMVKKLYPHADTVVALTKRMGKDLHETFGLRNRIVVIYNAINSEESDKLAQEPLPTELAKLFDDSFVFVSIGMLKEAKGQVHLIRAFKEVADHNKKTKLIILGEGNYRNKLENLINKLKINDKVFLVGLHNNVYPFLKKSDCFVFSSLWEGFANVILEALSANMTIISTDCVTGPREILTDIVDYQAIIRYPYFGKYGILTEPMPIVSEKISYSTDRDLFDEEIMLADLMKDLINNKLLKEKYSNVQLRINDFNPDTIMKQWVEMIESI